MRVNDKLTYIIKLLSVHEWAWTILHNSSAMKLNLFTELTLLPTESHEDIQCGVKIYVTIGSSQLLDYNKIVSPQIKFQVQFSQKPQSNKPHSICKLTNLSFQINNYAIFKLSISVFHWHWQFAIQSLIITIRILKFLLLEQKKNDDKNKQDPWDFNQRKMCRRKVS